MTEIAKNSQGDEIIVDDSATEAEAKHPSASQLDDADKRADGSTAKADDGSGLRTSKSDEPVAQRLGTGAGEHVAPPGVTDPDEFDADGRYRAPGQAETDEVLADESENKERQKAADAEAKASG